MFSYTLWAPYRPGRLKKSSVSGHGEGAHDNRVGLDSIVHQPDQLGVVLAALGRIASWVTTSRSRLKKGITVWVNPGKGGAKLRWAIMDGPGLVGYVQGHHAGVLPSRSRRDPARLG